MNITRNALMMTAVVAVAGMIGGAFIGHSQNGFVGTKNCGMCHPNELKAYQGHKHAAAQGEIPDETGIGCESCHGPGEAHVALGPKKLQELAEEKGDLKIVSNNTSELCGTCHSGSDNDNINLAADGLIVAMQQYNELMRSRKAQFKITCVACHDPHMTSVNQEGISRKCADCHTGKYKIEIKIRAMQDLACEDCHMPFVVSEGEGTMVQAFQKGEHRSHIFGITVDEDYTLNDGTNHASLTDDGLARLTVETTCYACHKTGGAKDLSREQLLSAAEKIH